MKFLSKARVSFFGITKSQFLTPRFISSASLYIGSEQSGNRPAVVLQNDVGNFYSPTLIVATLTSKAAKKYTQPTHCLLVNDFLSVPSIVQAEQIFTVDKSRVLKFLGHLTPEEMSRVDDAVRASLALNPMGSIQRLPPIIRSTAAYAPPEVVDGKPPISNSLHAHQIVL